MATRKAAVKRAPVRKQRVELNLPDFNGYNQDGEYFHAIVKGERIAGQVRYKSEDEIYLDNQQGVGEENECDNTDLEFGHAVYLNPNASQNDEGYYIDGEFDWEAEFIKQGVEEFTIVTDRRLVKIIEDTKIAAFADWSVRVKDGKAIFGCGAVALDVDEMTTFLEGRPLDMEKEEIEKKISDLEDELYDKEQELEDMGYKDIVDTITEHMELEDIDLEEVAELIDKVDSVLSTDIDHEVSKVKVVKGAVRKR